MAKYVIGALGALLGALTGTWLMLAPRQRFGLGKQHRAGTVTSDNGDAQRYAGARRSAKVTVKTLNRHGIREKKGA